MSAPKFLVPGLPVFLSVGILLLIFLRIVLRVLEILRDNEQ